MNAENEFEAWAEHNQIGNGTIYQGAKLAWQAAFTLGRQSGLEDAAGIAEQVSDWEWIDRDTSVVTVKAIRERIKELL